MSLNPTWALRPLILTLFTTTLLVACGGGGSELSLPLPAEPVGVGGADTAPIPTAAAYVDTGVTNTRSNPCNVTLATNAGARVLQGFLDLWTPSTLLVDAGVTLAAANGCPAVTASTWTGIPGDSTDGTVKNSTVHTANIGYVKTATQNRSTSQALAAYLDDRRNKGYSVSDGLGPLTSLWRQGAQQTTTITAVDPTQAVSPAVSDSGNNLGVGSSANADLGLAVDFINGLADGSTEPPKRFYKYARPWRWSSDVKVVPALESAKSSTPATDGGFPSGHTAEAWRDTLAMAYLVPQRYQELISRAMEMGENRILAGMHSPLDVMGGRVHATAVVAYNLSNVAYYSSAVKSAAYKQAQAYLQSKTGSADFNALNTYAHATKTSDSSSADYDRFASYSSNRSTYLQRLTYGFSQINAAGQTSTVPKGAEVLLETRLPYLTADQRRVVLKSTALDSGYPLGNDGEGWGRLNLFAAADGYGNFNGDVAVTMDASQGGFNALDSWRNNIAGKGMLSKLGSGSLRLTGANNYSGGTVLSAGTLGADSTTALGTGDVFVKGGTLECTAPGALTIGGAYSQSAGTLSLVMKSASQGVLTVQGNAVIKGGDLKVSFSGYTPAVGTTLTVLMAGARSGQFGSVSVTGFSKVTPLYQGNTVQIRLDAI